MITVFTAKVMPPPKNILEALERPYLEVQMDGCVLQLTIPAWSAGNEEPHVYIFDLRDHNHKVVYEEPGFKR